ncbi:hypothetical protein SCB49_11412 [unidentified eubacterium SCB49]|nr:hypothetical protein SCB49_11412 [unidentified eubacterium SCB49]
MKLKYFGLLFIMFIQSCVSQNIKSDNKENISNAEYKNAEYSFSVSYPTEWNIHREILNDTVYKSAFIQLGMPKIYSEFEKTEIENSVTIRAFESESINNIKDLILNEYLRIDPTTTALEAEQGIGKNARIIYHDAPNGTKYKGKTYFKYQNGLSYVITFMATPGTFQKNLNKFEQFYLTLKLE